MGDLWDAVDWGSLVGLEGAKAGYIDGAASEWPTEAWASLAPGPFVRISVLAAPGADAYDGETGNAGPEAVAAAIDQDISAKRSPWLYINESVANDYLAALKAKNRRPTDRASWPAPGFYLWPADPSRNIAAGRWQLPVEPVAVQDGYFGTHDHSALYVTLGAPVAPHPAPVPAPPPSVGGLLTVLIPELYEPATSETVRACQTLLGGLAVDGIFGPITKARVIEYQGAHGLTQDGIVGVHTWGSLLGHPQ